MNAKISVKGIISIDIHSSKRTIVYRDIIEGKATKGMSLFVPLNSSTSVSPKIESIEFMDLNTDKTSYTAWVLVPEGTPEEQFRFYTSLNFTNEVLEIRNA